MVTQKITQKNISEHYGKNPKKFLKKGLKGRPYQFLDIYFCPFFKTESTFFLNFFSRNIYYSESNLKPLLKCSNAYEIN